MSILIINFEHCNYQKNVHNKHNIFPKNFLCQKIFGAPRLFTDFQKTCRSLIRACVRENQPKTSCVLARLLGRLEYVFLHKKVEFGQFCVDCNKEILTFQQIFFYLLGKLLHKENCGKVRISLLHSTQNYSTSTFLYKNTYLFSQTYFIQKITDE